MSEGNGHVDGNGAGEVRTLTKDDFASDQDGICAPWVAPFQYHSPAIVP